MPISKYFKGHGNEVYANMQKEYGPKKGESVFYATANKRKMKPKKLKSLHPGHRELREAMEKGDYGKTR